MAKFILFIFLVSYTPNLLGQVIKFPEKTDTIPVTVQDKRFINFIEEGYLEQICKKSDSVLIFYEITPNTNYALLLSKKRNGLTMCEAYYEYIPNGTPIQKEKLNNKVLEKFNFLEIYSIMSDVEVRTEDTTVLFLENYPVYAQFYFRGKSKCFVGFQGMVRYKMNRIIVDEMTEENNRILLREMKKHNKQN